MYVCVPFVRINPLVLCYEITSNLFNSFVCCLFCSVFLLSPLLSGCGTHAQHKHTLSALCVSEHAVLSLKSSHYIGIPSLSDEYQRRRIAKHTKSQIKSIRCECFISISYNSFLHFHYASDALLFGIQMTYKHIYAIQFVRDCCLAKRSDRRR